MKWCPQCHLLLERAADASGDLCACASCGGVWIPAAAVGAVSSDTIGTLTAAYPGVSAAGSFEGLQMPCPDCRTSMLTPTDRRFAERPALTCTRCEGCWVERADPTQPSASPQPPADVAPALEPPAGVVAPEPAARIPDSAVAAAADSLREPALVEAPPPVAAPAAQFAAEPPPALEVAGPPAPAVPVAPPRADIAAPMLQEPWLEEPCRDAEAALERLMEGNRRFATDTARQPNQDSARRAETVKGQQPFAVIVGCSDSRVPPEVLFDRGIGDLFVIRSAGQILGKAAEASIAYAVHHLNVRLVLVLGHSSCGAVRAAVQGAADGAELATLVRAIRPSVDAVRAGLGDLGELAARRNAQAIAARLSRPPSFIAADCATGDVMVAAAYYDLASGEVEALPNLEEQESDLAAGASPAAPAAGAMAAWSSGTAEAQGEEAVRPGAVELAPPATGPDQAIGGPTGPSAFTGSTKWPRWCPRCRGGFDTTMSFCTTCGIALVEPWFRVPCLRCRKENLIGMQSCWSCHADLHPVTLPTEQRRQIGGMGRLASRLPPRVRVSGRDGVDSCSSSVFVTLLWILVASTALMAVRSAWL